MREILEDLKKWHSARKSIAIATIVKANGSPMRPLGSKMAVTTDHGISGSVTGGCIEGAVYEEAQQVIQSGKPRIVRYGVASDQTPWEIGLTCGSSLDVLIEPWHSAPWDLAWQPIQNALENHQLLACVTLISGENLGTKMLVLADGSQQGSLGSAKLDQAAVEAVQKQLVSEDSTNATLEANSQKVEVFIDIFIPPSRLFIVGAVHIAIPLVTLAKTAGFYTLVLDPRKTFNNRERFADADELLVEWPADALAARKPDGGTFVAVVSHDEKLDNPAIAVALKNSVKYVGVLGTKRKIPERLDALRELGVNEEQLKNLHAPIGLNLGAIQPQEIALSILAEMVAVRHGHASNDNLALNAPR